MEWQKTIFVESLEAERFLTKDWTTQVSKPSYYHKIMPPPSAAPFPNESAGYGSGSRSRAGLVYRLDVDASMRRRVDASTRRRVDASTRRRVDASMRRRVDVSRHDSAEQRCSGSGRSTLPKARSKSFSGKEAASKAQNKNV